MCINTNSYEFQTLKNKSGLSEFELEAQIEAYESKYGRWPNLDELDEANSEPYIRENLEIRKDNSTRIETILERTNTTDIKDAKIQLNNEFRDKEIDIIPLRNDAIVNIVERPTTTKDLSETTYEQEDLVNNAVLLATMIDKLQEFYGINIHYIKNSELNSEEFTQIPGIQEANAFVYNGEIYVNLDNATIDAPLHEMLHLIFGSIKYSDPELYYNLVDQAEQFSSYNRTAKLYPNRTRGDLNEEIFITELSKYLSGKQSDLNNLDDKVMHDISYNMYRLLDSALMGGVSTKVIPEPVLYNLTLKEVANIVNSAVAENHNGGSLNASEISRIMANVKSDLLNKGLLREECS